MIVIQRRIAYDRTGVGHIGAHRATVVATGAIAAGIAVVLACVALAAGAGMPRAALVDPTATKRWDRLSPGGSEERRGRGNGTKESNTHVVRSAENCTRTVCEPVFCR